MVTKAFGTERVTCSCAEQLCFNKFKEATPNIATAPQILIMQLNRFEYNPPTSAFSKREDLVRIPHFLDLTPYQRTNNHPLRYRLRSVIQHRGTLNYGHYITLVRGPSGHWMKMDDDNRVQRKSFSDAWSLGEDEEVPSKGKKEKEKEKRKDEPKREGNVWTSYMLFWEMVEDVPPVIATNVLKEFDSCERQVGVTAGMKRKLDSLDDS